MAGSPSDFAIGDIVMSTLNEQHFQNQHGGPYEIGKQPAWVLCDGRNVSGSEYEHVSGSSYVPDLVGRYPRGADVGGKTSVVTPAAGQQMEDALASHVHSYHAYKAEADSGTGFVGSDFKSNSGGQNDLNWATDYASSGPQNCHVADETRPKTTIVNFFIRIN